VDDAHDPTEFTQILARLRAGDLAAAEALYRAYGPFLRVAVRRRLHPRLRARFDSLDFVQDVWASFLTLPADRYAFDTPQALLAFLNRVAHNKVTEVFRQRFGTQKDDVTREDPDGTRAAARDQLPSPGPTPSQWAVAGEAWERLLSRVPPGYWPILERLREGYTHEDIARMTNVSIATVNRIVRRLKDLTGL
jgi:RNA polymerase sigma factor (sigma-70 family)